MAEEILDKVRDALDGPIDFEGQRLAELLQNVFLSFVGVLALVLGYALQNIVYTVYVGLAGTALAFLLIVPPWPFYNKNTPSWLPPRSAPAVAGIKVSM